GDNFIVPRPRAVVMRLMMARILAHSEDSTGALSLSHCTELKVVVMDLPPYPLPWLGYQPVSPLAVHCNWNSSASTALSSSRIAVEIPSTSSLTGAARISSGTEYPWAG